MATIKEVAQRAGVSVTTVSRVLNKRGYISQEMHDKIYATMEELNYQPNEVARSLTRRRTKIIGLLVPSVDDPYFGEVVNQLILAAMRHGYKVMIYASDGQNDRALEYVGMLKANQVDGIIISLRSRELDCWTTTFRSFPSSASRSADCRRCFVTTIWAAAWRRRNCSPAEASAR